MWIFPAAGSTLLCKVSLGQGDWILSGSPTDRVHRGISVEDERWTLVQRILASRHFQKAPQLREILLYLSRRTIEDNPSAISEHDIGCNVLGRRPDFNPNEDNIVRVQVRHLRKKLEDYFGTEGLEEQLILVIPKGGYVPRFELRSTQPAQRPAVGAELIYPEPGPALEMAPPAEKASYPWRVVAVLSVLVATLAVAAIILWRQKEALRLGALVSGQSASPPGDVLWSKMFASGQEVTVVASDTCFVMLQDILDLDIPLSEYLSGAYPLKFISSVHDRKLREALQLISLRRYTSLGDMSVAEKVLELSHRYNRMARIRYARYLDAREFKTGNFVLIGSRRGIPWLQLFEPQLNFSLEESPGSRKYYFRNKAPRPGEQKSYGIASDGQPTAESYADIALLPNLEGTGYVLLLSGITMEMTEAAGELVTSPEFSSVLSKMLNSRAGDARAPYMEILLQAKAVPGTTRASKIICYRILTPQKPDPTS